jgi:mRNA-degrading endonuclease YafQ of YafQ-DinJ toxin-antitoxin module
MRITNIFYEPHFERAFKKLTPDLKAAFMERLPVFMNDCFEPRLKTHKLSGKQKNLWSFSLDYSYRVLFKFMGDGQVGFMDIGDHDIYK